MAMALPQNAGVWATVQWLAARKLPALPVAPAQDPYRYPRIVAAKPQGGIYDHVECHWQDGQLRPKPLFTGKNSSYLDGQGIPHLVYHHRYQNRLPTQQELHQWFFGVAELRNEPIKAPIFASPPKSGGL